MTREKDTEMVKSIMSMTSKSEMGGSVTRFKTFYKNEPLHEHCSLKDIGRMREVFEEAFMGKFLYSEFRDVLNEILSVEYDDEEYNRLFLKINTARNGEVNWDEFVSHLILGYFINDEENQRGTLQLPIMGLPVVLRSRHRHYVSRIRFNPDVYNDRSVDPLQGCYLSVSSEGLINWWDLDMNLQRSAYSVSPMLKVRTTWVTDMVVMADVNILVTSSTERDLRFYDITAKTFTLKIHIYSWEYMICTMHYKFHKDPNEQCKLVCGDVGGCVRILVFSPIERGPFKSEAGRALTSIRHLDMQKHPNIIPAMRLIEFLNLHDEWVRQVSWYTSLQCFVSCATCIDSLLMCDINGGTKTRNMFHTEKGVQCFAFDETVHMLATGGPDCDVRVWNVFVTAKPTMIFQGHHAGIVNIVIQDHGEKIYSLARDRVIKVWDLYSQTCVQTYIDIPSYFGERSPITAVYNVNTREYIMASMMIAILTLDEKLNPLHTDGTTHSKAISKVLYNKLFKIVLTCGMDSIIICWDPITGHRNSMIQNAHTEVVHGELIPIEITAACFDPGDQSLLTGARNGSLKIWNFNTGSCLRNMSIQYMSEVTGVFWVEGRILAIGWNRQIIEFEDQGTSIQGKAWEMRHSDDVLAAAARPPLSLVTTSYNSEIVLWKLETGQPYRRFSASDPMLRIKMVYSKRDLAMASKGCMVSYGPPKLKKCTIIKKPVMRIPADGSIDLAAAVKKAQIRRVTIPPTDAREVKMRPLAIHAVCFLETRECLSNVASFLIAIENGYVQAWSDHPAGGFKAAFQAVHTMGDYVSAMCTDEQNNYLFCGTTIGYIKVWLMTNYCIGNEEVHINMPSLRLEFPFLWRDRIEGRAKRCVRDQPLPMQLNSYRGHLRCISSMVYIDEYKLLLTGSSDYSVRIWKLTGEYLQTMGGFAPWSLEITRFPPDVKKIASFTTFKVWRGGWVDHYTPGQKEIDPYADITEWELRNKTYPKPAEDPLLGSYFVLPKRPDRQDPIILDDSLPTIPLYAHLRMASTQPIRRPPTPDLVKKTRIKLTLKAEAEAKRAKARFGSDNALRSQSVVRRRSGQSSHGMSGQFTHGMSGQSGHSGQAMTGQSTHGISGQSGQSSHGISGQQTQGKTGQSSHGINEQINQGQNGATNTRPPKN